MNVVAYSTLRAHGPEEDIEHAQAYSWHSYRSSGMLECGHTPESAAVLVHCPRCTLDLDGLRFFHGPKLTTYCTAPYEMPVTVDTIRLDAVKPDVKFGDFRGQVALALCLPRRLSDIVERKFSEQGAQIAQCGAHVIVLTPAVVAEVLVRLCAAGSAELGTLDPAVIVADAVRLAATMHTERGRAEAFLATWRMAGLSGALAQYAPNGEWFTTRASEWVSCSRW